MDDVKISQVLNIERRYLRSTQLERDFRDENALQGYVVTAQAKQSFDRVAEGLNEKSGQRAWRITGDYGSGKSSFALLIAHLFSGKDSELPPQISKSLDLENLRQNNAKYLPVLVTGSRESISLALLRGLHSSLVRQVVTKPKLKVIDKISDAIAQAGIGTQDGIALTLIAEANSELIAAGKTNGLLIILDELGKFLEFAALHPERQDVFFLQQLAEYATRSGSEPIFIIGLLHQGFNAYADLLSQSAQKEWEKIAGRFEEILFDQPLEQVTQLISSALNSTEILRPRGVNNRFQTAMEKAVDLGWFGASPAAKSLTEPAPKLYPLHPTLIPVLVRLFNRFGQNERSLFSFLLSSELYGLQAFTQAKATANQNYLIHNLYDYAASNFGHRLSVQSYRSHWNHIESLIRSFPAQDEIELFVLKTVGLLNLINSPELIPTDESLVLALGSHSDEYEKNIRTAIARLQKERHVLFWRGRAGGYCLWSHTSVNLEESYETASRAIGQSQRVAAHITEQLDARPLVARRHYIETGNLRHFNIVYCTVTNIENAARDTKHKADGRVVIALCETNEEKASAIKFAKSLKFEDILFGVTEPLTSLSGLLLEVRRWTWIQSNTPELKNDRYASEEVARQLAVAKQALEKQVHHYAGLKQSRSNTMSLQWYCEGEQINIRSATELLSRISDICNQIYSDAPVIRNEIINRRSLSSAAAAARMRLIERMLNFSDQEMLGMDKTKKPPEMSIYMSLLKESKVHVRKNNVWSLQEPDENDDPCNLLPSLRVIREVLETHSDARLSVSELVLSLQSRPYGVRDGVIPILLVITLLKHEHEIALYENGTFLSTIGKEEILRLTKSPESFDLQFCRVQGVRRKLFEKLGAVLDLNLLSKKSDVLDVVRPLCVFVAELPEYSRQTTHLSEETRAVRNRILSAREPGTLLFKEIPEALGLNSIGNERFSTLERDTVQDYVGKLKASLDELKGVYPRLMSWIRDKILSAFEAPKSGAALANFRNDLSARCQHVLVDVSDIDLKAFCLRLLDCRFDDVDWLESVGSFVATTPPSRWKDGDEVTFTEKLEVLIRKYRRLESLHFPGVKNPASGSAIRVSLTVRDGREQERVVHLSAEEDNEAEQISKQIYEIIGGNEKVSISAMSRVIWGLLEKKEGTHGGK
jgi:hypothetical protein